MTDKEKAQAYDEALKKARRIKNGEDNWRYSDLTEIIPALEDVLPELAESEDERIRRTLVEYFGPGVQLDFVRGVPIQKIREWLEKQKDLDKVIVVSPEVWDNAINDAYENGKKDNEKQKEQKPVDYDHEMWKNCEANFEGGKKEVINNPEKYGLQKPAERSLEDDHIIGFVYDLLNEIEWKDNWAMSKEECLRLLNNYCPQKPAEWNQDEFTENIRRLITDKLTVMTKGSDGGTLSSTVFIDDKTAKDIANGILFYVGKEAQKNPDRDVPEWSEDDEKMLNQLIYDVEYHKKDGLVSAKQNKATKVLYNGIEKCYDEKIVWLKNLPERFNLQPKQEWSEEDSDNLERVDNYLWMLDDYVGDDCATPQGKTDKIRENIQKVLSPWLKFLPERFNLQPKAK